MSEQQSLTRATESDGISNPTAQADKSQQERIRESSFTNQVIDTARHYGWRPFHLRDRDSKHIVSGRGFPDLVMFRKDQETGQIELLTAELKRGYDSKPTAEQEEWLEALGQHLPAYTWRPENWNEIENALKNGAADHPNTPQPETEPSSSPIPPNFYDVITNIIEAIEAKEMTTGEKASLRRMDPSNPNSAVFWKLISQRGMSRNPDIKKWGLITHGIALMSHTAGLAHNSRKPVGRVLYEGNQDRPRTAFYSEDRLATLLAAREPTLHRLLARLFRMLASKGCTFNWREMAWFILNDDEYNEERADEARIKIARAYYQAEYRSAQSTGE